MATRRSLSIFVRQIPWVVDKRDLKNYFSKYGDVTSVSMPFDRDSGLPKGYATVWFQDRRGYQKALDEVIHVMEHQKLIVFPSIDHSNRHYADE